MDETVIYNLYMKIVASRYIHIFYRKSDQSRLIVDQLVTRNTIYYRETNVLLAKQKWPTISFVKMPFFVQI